MSGINSIQGVPQTPQQIGIWHSPMKNFKYAADEINLKDLLPKSVQDQTISQFKCLTDGISGQNNEAIEMYYIPSSGFVILNNKNATNHTVEIAPDGKAKSVGSWHNTVLDGNYKNVIEEIQAQIKEKEQAGQDKLNAQLDAAATLGRSMVN